MSGKKGPGRPPGDTEALIAQREEIYSNRDIAYSLVKRNDDDHLWDAIQARDVDPKITAYVIDQLEAGFTIRQVLRSLGIPSSQDKRAKKILSAIKQGIRVDSTGMYVRWHTQNEAVANKLQKLIESVLDDQLREPEEDIKESKTAKMRRAIGITKELSMAVDALNRLRQGTVKLGKELGVFVDPDAAKGPGGVTIVVQSNVALASQKDVKARVQSQKEANKKLLDNAKAIPAIATPVGPSALSKPKT